ncbi:hypothetical protein [Hymenobacter algoricola]|uniref:Uncharacterized protein n=1 Tax=Hymenobacter algoricola TaxID=486267 RepID=A0ABP7N212_9BACT
MGSRAARAAGALRPEAGQLRWGRSVYLAGQRTEPALATFCPIWKGGKQPATPKLPTKAMATDGIKIIDGDLAHDVYYTFMELYDAGRPLDELKATIEQLQAGNDDFDDEIFITAYALALREIGELSPQVLAQVERAIQRGAFVRYLTEEDGSPIEGRRRQQVLDRFWKNINQPNLRIRRRKSHQPQKKLVFEEGDVLTFQLIPDGIDCITILLRISQSRGRCVYCFILHSCTGVIKPTMQQVLSGSLLGHPAIPGSQSPRIGFAANCISHKDLLACATKFECIGKLTINEEAKRVGSEGGATSFQDFTGNFRYLERGILIRRAKKCSLKHLL